MCVSGLSPESDQHCLDKHHSSLRQSPKGSKCEELAIPYKRMSSSVSNPQRTARAGLWSASLTTPMSRPFTVSASHAKWETRSHTTSNETGLQRAIRLSDVEPARRKATRRHGGSSKDQSESKVTERRQLLSPREDFSCSRPFGI